MNNAKLNLSFVRYSDDSLDTKAAFILQMLTGNDHVPHPVPPLADLQAAITAYETALVDAGSRDRLKVAIKKASRLTLEAVLTKLGRYVIYLANGNEELLVGSGFDLGKQPETAILAEPGPVSLTAGISSGRMAASITRVKGAYSYVFEIAPDPVLPDSKWTSMPLSRSNCVFEGLTPGQRYWVRVAAVGSGTQVAYSQAVSQIAV